jgi:anti-sigma factor ChrR (cupin superfamily)
MTDNADDLFDLEMSAVAFDEVVAVALAAEAAGPEPRPSVKARLMSRIAEAAAIPSGFRFEFAADNTWRPHPVPGITMKVLSVNERSGYATLLLDVQPGTRFPAHHHGGDEECFVISGSVHTLGRRLGPGDFVHADAGTDHAELYTDEGARVLLVVPVEELH